MGIMDKIKDNVNKDYNNPNKEKANNTKEVKKQTPIQNKEKTQAEKEKEDKIKANDKEEWDFLVELNDVWGTSSKRYDPFGVKRAIIGGNVFLVNEKIGFKEPQPEDSDDYKSYKIDELTTEIAKIEKKLKEIKSKDGKETTRDLIQDIKILKGWKRSLELQGRGSYANLSGKRDNGMPYFIFDRKGNFKLPVFKNVDYSLLYVPSETNISEASDLLKENNDKNNLNAAQLRIINYILTFILVICICGMFYFIYKTNNTQALYVNGGLSNLTESINNIVNQNSETINIIADVINSNSSNVVDNTITVTPTNLN